MNRTNKVEVEEREKSKLKKFSNIAAADIEQLSRFASGGYCDDSTIVYLQHPCVILTALEVLGYKVVASSSTIVKQDYNEYMWTMRKEFSEPEPEVVKQSGMIKSINFSILVLYFLLFFFSFLSQPKFLNFVKFLLFCWFLFVLVLL